MPSNSVDRRNNDVLKDAWTETSGAIRSNSREASERVDFDELQRLLDEKKARLDDLPLQLLYSKKTPQQTERQYQAQKREQQEMLDDNKRKLHEYVSSELA